jgi:hypothetical protein
MKSFYGKAIYYILYMVAAVSLATPSYQQDVLCGFKLIFMY